MADRRRIETKAARAFALKHYARALEHLEELLGIVGENPQTLYMIALCHARRDEISTAVRFARRALAAEPDHLDCLKLLARLHFLRDEHAEARDLAARAVCVMQEAAETPAPRRLADRLRAGLGGGDPAREDREWLEWARAYLGSIDEDDASGA